MAEGGGGEDLPLTGGRRDEEGGGGAGRDGTGDPGRPRSSKKVRLALWRSPGHGYRLV